VAGKAHGRVYVMLVACALMAGCFGPHREPSISTAITTSPNLSPLEDAREVMGYFRVLLPTDAQQIHVVRPPLERFRAKALVSFVAPRAQVINQTCQNLKNVYPDYRPLLINPSFEGQILEYANITINRDDYGYCDQYEGGRKILVLIPRAEGGITYVVLYHVPYR
jgi:hypothetical protein